MSVKELEAEMMRLGPREQAYLFEKLGQLLVVEEEPLTNEELEQRSKDLQSGRVKGVTPEEMFSAARRLL